MQLLSDLATRQPSSNPTDPDRPPTQILEYRSDLVTSILPELILLQSPTRA